VTFFAQKTFRAAGVRSLCWRGGELVDWVGGGRAFRLDGAERPTSIYHAYRFDAATASRDGRFAAIYERLGTKALLLQDGKLLRELNRSHYHADIYEYPIAIFNNVDGRLLLAHCPSDYNRIEFEEVETGRTLTASTARKPRDYFHSRLAASPSGRLSDPVELDDHLVLPRLISGKSVEESSASWLDDNLIVAATTDEEIGPQEDQALATHPLSPHGLAVYDLDRRTCLNMVQLSEPAGTIFAVGAHHVLSLFGHPKLIELSTGKVIHVWNTLQSGSQDGSIVHHLEGMSQPPPMAFDAQGCRFAIANGDALTILEFDRAALAASVRSP
jgi:hypothetical protein